MSITLQRILEDVTIRPVIEDSWNLVQKDQMK